MDVSFIIPTHNEQETISDVIFSIQHNMVNLPHLKHEIIVVDNASSDHTVQLVRELCDTFTNVHIMLVSADCNPSEVRNKGANTAAGKVLVFLDGDVTLNRNWNTNFSDIYNEVLNEKLVTGSVVGVPNTSNWILNHYFKPIVNKQRNYINSGHLIVSKNWFYQLGGFDRGLETGEDSEFSARAKAKGFKIQTNNLPVTHLGFPKTLADFFARERWHGKGNWTMGGWHKMKIFIILFWVGFVIGIVHLPFMLIPVMLGVLMGVKRCGITKHLPYCIVLSWIILGARGVSLIDVLHDRG